MLYAICDKSTEQCNYLSVKFKDFKIKKNVEKGFLVSTLQPFIEKRFEHLCCSYNFVSEKDTTLLSVNMRSILEQEKISVLKTSVYMEAPLRIICIFY